jgi:adenylate kinase family enzyme
MAASDSMSLSYRSKAADAKSLNLAIAIAPECEINEKGGIFLPLRSAGIMEEQMQIYITGASCAGVTTLGQSLASRLGLCHADVDDYFWMPTNPPFTTKRPVSERVLLLQQALGQDDWILTGSCMVWGDALLAHVDPIVFVVTPTPIRLERLAAREKARFGDRIAPGGDMHETHAGFREWASQYDNPDFSGRNRVWHERWLSEQSSPVLQIDGAISTEKMASKVTQAMSHLRHYAPTVTSASQC